MKADKGNKIVILDKSDYKETVNELITKCKYQKVKKNPLPKMIRDSDILRKRISENFGILGIPVDLALIEFKRHLDETEVSEEKKLIYLETAQLCMDQSFFQIDGEIFKVTKGTNMGNSLSPLIAELFLSYFEVNLSDQSLLPRVWWRYVDDVFADIRGEDISKILELLNSQNSSIQFTCEEEQNGKLPFLDLELQRLGEKIEVGIYHKPSSTMRTIIADSHTPIQHKKAAYHSLIHRLCNLPLSLANFKNEYEYTKNVAIINGYNEIMVDELIFLPFP